MNLNGYTPRNDSVIIRRMDREKIGSIYLSQPEKGIEGVVVAVGPGKWVEGTWWFFYQPSPHWEWIPGHREQALLKVGDKVLFNSRWNDFEDRDYAHNLPLALREHKDLHLVQEADIYGWLNG